MQLKLVLANITHNKITKQKIQAEDFYFILIGLFPSQETYNKILAVRRKIR